MTAREIRRKKPLKSVTKSIGLSITIMMRLETQDAENGIHRKFGYSYDQDGTIVCRMDRSLPKETSRSFTYDSKGRLTHFMDECGAITRLFYDANDRIIKLVQPEQYNPARDDGNGIS